MHTQYSIWPVSLNRSVPFFVVYHFLASTNPPAIQQKTLFQYTLSASFSNENALLQHMDSNLPRLTHRSNYILVPNFSCYCLCCQFPFWLVVAYDLCHLCHDDQHHLYHLPQLMRINRYIVSVNKSRMFGRLVCFLWNVIFIT